MNIVKQQTLKKAKHRVDEKKEISSPLSSPSLYGVAGKKNVNLLVLFIDNMSLQAFYDTMPLTIGWLKKRMAESSGEEPSSNPEKDIMVHQFLRFSFRLYCAFSVIIHAHEKKKNSKHFIIITSP